MAIIPYKNVLVTGAAGFIGSHFVKLLLQQNHSLHIISLDKLTYAGNRENLRDLPSNQHHFIQGDICDKHLIEALFKEYNIDAIIHFAAESHVDNSIVAPDEFIRTNLVGTFTLVEVAKQIWLDERKLPSNA